MQYAQIPNGHIIPFPNEQDFAAHQTEIHKLSRLKKKAWILLDSNRIQTRFHLQPLVLNFKPSQEPTSIQGMLQNVCSNIKMEKNGECIDFFYLVSKPLTEEVFYEISDYVNRCIAGDLSVAERLRGRTIIYISQTEDSAFDLLSDNGVQDYIDEYLYNYIRRYDTTEINGFIVDMPRFLSTIDVIKQASLPWSHSVLQYLNSQNMHLGYKSKTNTDKPFLPFLFYEAYDSPIVRSFYWQILSSQFSRCFMKGIREFCHQHGFRFAAAIRESARSLEYDLGTLLENVDCPILTTLSGDTSRRFAVSKYICSNKTQPGITSISEHTFSGFLSDASIGFNHWVTEKKVSLHSEKYEHGIISKLLQVGLPKREILMIAPTQSLWMKPEENQWNSIIKAWGWLCKTVWNLGYDFDIVSENHFIKATVDIDQCQIHLDGNPYQLVLLPCSISLHETSVQRLTEYTKSKGKIIANAPVPYLLNGRIGLEPYLLERLLYKRQTIILDGPENEREIDIKKYLNSFVSQRITVYSKETDQRCESIRLHIRQDKNRNLYFIFNTDKNSIATLIEIIGEFKNVKELNLKSGKEIDAEFWHANRNTYFNCTFKSENGSLFIVS